MARKRVSFTCGEIQGDTRIFLVLKIHEVRVLQGHKFQFLVLKV